MKKGGKEERLDRSTLSHEGLISYAFVSPFLTENLLYISSWKFQLIKFSTVQCSVLFERTVALPLPEEFSDPRC